MALQQIGWLVMTGGKYEEAHGERARELAGRALELARVDRRQARPVGLAEHPGRARPPRRATRRRRTSCTSRASTLRRELGDKRLIANSLLTLGRAELTRGDYEKATAHLQEGFALARELGDTWSMSLALDEPRPRAPCARARTTPRRRSSSPTRSSSPRSAATSASPPSASRAWAPSTATGGDERAGRAALRRVRRAARVDRRDADDDRGRAQRAVPPDGEVEPRRASASRREWVAGREEAPESAIEEALSHRRRRPRRRVAASRQLKIR